MVDRDRDRRIAAAVNFAVQIFGVLLLIFGNGWVLLTLGCILFGLGIGNLTSLPPLIAQEEFKREDVVTVVALVVAINQAVFAFAPAIREIAASGGLLQSLMDLRPLHRPAIDQLVGELLTQRRPGNAQDNRNGPLRDPGCGL